MNIRERFLQLTSSTYPHGRESKLFKFLPDNLFIDEWGNLYVEVGYNPDCMFCCHLDTYSSGYRHDYYDQKVKHIFRKNEIHTDGSSILGADDKAGVVIMLNMIEHSIPGLYYFFLGEELGCLGSKKLAKSGVTFPNIKKVISFDKRGTSSIATFMRGTRSCSDTFAEQLASQLNRFDLSYELDPDAGSTDSLSFVSIYPECTNLSVGYFNEHTHREYQDMAHLEKLCRATLEIDWSLIPALRDPSTTETREYISRRWAF